MLDQLKIAGQYLLPKHLLSRLLGKLASAEAGGLTTFLIEAFIKKYQVNMAEALDSNPSNYKTFNDFFTRALKEDARPILAQENQLAMPVDGKVSQVGQITQGRIFQAKGHDFSARELLGGFDIDVAPFDEGSFANIYLAPKDYHRIHMPVAGKLEKMLFVPGDLFSVNPLTAENIPNLFARNERVVALFTTEKGPLAMVLVGATIVASIETVWAGTVAPANGKQVQVWDYSEQNITLEKGEEMGRFKLGSTIVALFPKDTVTFSEHLTPGAPTRLGEVFASYQ
ncbi:archaetidylserine decarboxylase [Motilimonas cestriensis]|uniref:Phosphatidylserine decarboxylase proenzyme n=1 Tax=Motilimonas cestriensis TaxID=2742685 RepID=A0ABS8WA36_9GAMM|nr:archaetidylserine decarboxylase [Motilimonas cestriensis]